MADQLISAFVEKLLDYIAVPVGRLCSYPLRYNANMEEFRSQHSGLETRRNDVKLRVEAAERKGDVILPSVEAWLKRVDAASDESKGFVEEEDGIGKRCFNGPLNLKVRYQRSRKAKKKALEFDAIKKDGTFDEISAPPPPLQTWSVDNESEFDFGSRRSIFSEIIEAIKDEGVGMIGIWGAGGIGKTTLVKRVAKCAKDEGPFEVVAMAVVSQNLSVTAIQGQIADNIGLTLTREGESGRAGQLLQRLLALKKILIILDDIWASIDLNAIGIPCGTQHKDCKIILTTRIRDVCEEMGTKKIFQIDLLSANEALDLFLRMSGVDDRLSEKGRLAQSLSQECGGLPICIAIVARGLLNKPEVSWEDMLNRLSNSDPVEIVYNTIKISYDHLTREEERMFFLLCALFPEDYRIPVQVLFEYGLGLDFFEKVDNVDEVAVRAQNMALRLKSQCLLLDEGDSEFVKMHDVIRDAALVIASKGNHAFLVQSNPQCREWSKKTAISLWSDDVKELPDALECPQLQILMLNCICPYQQLYDNFFAGMKNLVILDMSGMDFVRLPQSFASLEKLRTLRLNNCNVGDISAIGKLQNLVSLTLNELTIKVIPKEVGQLSKLRFLDFWNCYLLEVITPGVIQNLSQLEALIVVGRLLCCPGNASLSELNYLKRLIILDVCIPDVSNLPNNVLIKNLTKFQVSVGECHLGNMNIFSSSSQILKLVSVSKNELSKSGIKMLMKKAHHMELKNISGISVALPSDFSGYGSLKELIVSYCVDINYVLDMSGSKYELETPSLQLLHLLDLPSLKEISRGKFPNLCFSKLEHMRLHRLPSLVRLWSFQAESNLTTMEVTSCDKLEYVFDHDSVKGLSKLKELEVKKCINLQAICLSKEQDDDIVFPQLSRLELWELEKLASFGSKSASGSTLFGEKVHFPILKSIHLQGMKNVKKIWHSCVSTECLSQLQKLHVDECDQLEEVFPCHLSLNLNCLEQVTINRCHLLGGKNVLKIRANIPKLKSLVLHSDHEPIKWRESLDRCGGFQSLTSLNFYNSNGLKSLSTPSTISILRELYVSNCESMESIIGEENFDKSIEFSKLKTLILDELPRLASFYNGACALKFPWLGELSIKKCPKLKTFISMSKEMSEASSRNFVCAEALFGEQVSFGRLYNLRLEGLDLIEEIWHRDHLATTLSELSNLVVKGCDRLLKIFPSNLGEGLQNLESIEFSKLETLSLDELPRLASFYNGACALKFPWLYQLSIEKCPKLKTFISMSKEMSEPSCRNFVCAETLFGEQVSFGRLCNLRLEGLELIEEIWHRNHLATTLSELRYWVVKGCDRLLKIFHSNLGEGLQNLESIEFSKLETLSLDELPRLASFYNGACALKFPWLYQLSIEKCPKLKTFISMPKEMSEPSCLNFVCAETLFGEQVSFGRLCNLRLEGLELIEEIWHRNHLATTLSELTYLVVKGCDRLLKIFPSNLGEGLQNLESIEFSKLGTLSLDELPRLASFYNGACALKFPWLHELSIEKCPKLQTFISMSKEMSEPSCGNFVCSETLFGEQVSFGRLCNLRLEGLDLIEEIWHRDHLATTLSELRYLVVKSCDRLLKIFPSNLGEGLQNLESIEFSKLETLSLDELPRLASFYNGACALKFPWLGDLSIKKCLKLKTFISMSKEMSEPSCRNFVCAETLFGEQVSFGRLCNLRLERLELIEEIWHRNHLATTLSELRYLVVKGCDRLLKIFHSNLEEVLQNLESIEFSKLETLSLDELPRLPSFYNGACALKLPWLYELSIKKCPKLKTFISMSKEMSEPSCRNFVCAETLFGEQVSFGRLCNLRLEGLELIEEIWHRNHLATTLSELTYLVVKGCDRLLKIFPSNLGEGLQNLESIEFSKLGTLSLDELPRLASFYNGACALKFPWLHELSIEKCPKLQTFISMSKEMSEPSCGNFVCSETLFGEQVSFGRLCNLRLEGLELIEEIWHRNHLATTLSELTYLVVKGCDRLLKIFPSNLGEGLQNLESIEFSKLGTLSLDELPRLASFYNGACALKFPWLHELSIEKCPKLQTFISMSKEMSEPSCGNFVISETLFGEQVSFGRLCNLRLEGLELIEEIWHRNHLATTLSELRNLVVKGCDRLLKIFPSNLGEVQNLESLEVQSCRSLEHVFEVEDHPPVLSNLNNVELDDLPELKQLWWNMNTHEIFGLPSLDDLTIIACPALQFIFDPSVGNRMEKLTILKVKNCSSMVEIVAEKQGKNVKFPCLLRLYLVNLPCFKVKQDVAFQPSMLMKVFVERCFNLKESCRVKVED